ncbi:MULTISPECIES: MAE_28990/MAE_18760 family HEPN-like nuclease [unclassified Microcoleus]|uniref:MAE_28990/MAE_18760 family HEPN-like nuclease n=1 Tax=unclassified Microcoleus TaxID=2642155 RepID=UPI002FD5BF9F
MKKILKEFKERVKEVNLYFDFLSTVLSTDIHLCSTKSDVIKPIDVEVQKILKANFFLILYNLTEAIIKKSIQEIYDSMERDGLSYKLTRTEIQKILISYKYKQLRDSNSGNFVQAIEELLADALNDAAMKLDPKSIPISGNLDAQKIRELARTYGFSEMTKKAKRGGSDLLTVKNQRNLLAHGDLTFSECGRNYNISDLKRIKNEVICFLEDIIKNIKTYIDAKEYCDSSKK